MNDLMTFLYGGEAYPTAIETRGHQPYVTIFKDRLTYKFAGKRRYSEPGSVQANICAPKDCVLYYYEVEILSSETPCAAVFGFSKPTYYHNRHPGNQPSSVGYHGENGHRSNGAGKCVTYGSPYGCNDIIGCGINYIEQCYFFTRNGKHQGHAGDLNHCDNYPIVGLEKQGDTVKFNFVGPFKFDIAGEYRRILWQERQTITRGMIDATSLKKIVYMYLLHRGHKKTLESFRRESGLTLDCSAEPHKKRHSGECTICSQQKEDDEDEHPVCTTATATTREDYKSNLYINDATVRNLEATLDERHKIFQMVSSGQTSNALHTLMVRYPNGSIDKRSYQYCRLLTQHFIELVKRDGAVVALEWFRNTYDYSLLANPLYKKLIEETMGILCYKDLNCATVTDNYGKNRRVAVAHEVNELILGCDGDKNCLKVLVQFITLGRLLLRRRQGHTGPNYSPSYICQPITKHS